MLSKNNCTKNHGCRYQRAVFPRQILLWRPGLLCALLLLLVWASPVFSQPQSSLNPPVVVGASQIGRYLPLLKDKQVGLIVNHTSRVGAQHLADTLHQLGVCIARIFAPEHGFRGDADAGETILEGYDMRTGAQIVSLYGKRKKPAVEDLEGLDLVVFDIQDVGARFYTYISTMFLAMEACAEQHKAFVVLDRPNPNGHLTDGPVLDMRYTSFVGIAPLPIAHGCTVGELARLFKGECWINKGFELALTVVPCQNYTHHTAYNLPVPPSPNLLSTRAILLYPSLCLFEGSTCSVGRGTDWPFEVVGHPEAIDTFQFVPGSNPGNKYPLHAGWVCKGWDFRGIEADSLRTAKQLNINWLLDFYAHFPNKSAFFRPDNFMDLLAGTDQFQQQIKDGCNEAEIRATWAWDLQQFKNIRKPYLLYE